MITSCSGLIDAIVGNEDNPAPQPTSQASDQLKQGIWTEYDETLAPPPVEYTAEQLDAIENPENYTEEELEAIINSIPSAGTGEELPGVGMKIEGDKAYFFTYTAEDMSDFPAFIPMDVDLDGSYAPPLMYSS